MKRSPVGEIGDLFDEYFWDASTIVAQDGCEQRADLAGPQRAQRDHCIRFAFDRRTQTHRGWIAAAKCFVIALCRDEHETMFAKRGTQVPVEFERGKVRPVDVLDDKNNHAVGCTCGKRCGEVCIAPHALAPTEGVSTVIRRDEREHRKMCAQRLRDFDQRRVRRVAEFPTRRQRTHGAAGSEREQKVKLEGPSDKIATDHTLADHSPGPFAVRTRTSAHAILCWNAWRRRRRDAESRSGSSRRTRCGTATLSPRLSDLPKPALQCAVRFRTSNGRRGSVRLRGAVRIFLPRIRR